MADDKSIVLSSNKKQNKKKQKSELSVTELIDSNFSRTKASNLEEVEDADDIETPSTPKAVSTVTVEEKLSKTKETLAPVDTMTKKSLLPALPRKVPLVETDERVLEAQKASKGGAWNDDTIKDMLALQLEVGAVSSKSAPKTTHIPQTRSQQDIEALKALGLDETGINVLSRTIERKMLSNAGRSGHSLLAALNDDLASHKNSLTEWVTTTSAATSNDTQVDLEEINKTLSSMRERILTLEKRIDEVVTATFERSEAEGEMISYAYNLIAAQKREDAQTGETPSEVNALIETAQAIADRNERLSAMVANPTTVNSVPKSVQSKRKAKYGKLF